MPPIQDLLQSQGFPRAALRPDGNFDLSLIASGLYDQAEVRTTLSPPIKLGIRELLADGPPAPIVRLLKPTIILTGRAGRLVIAPGGEAGINGGYSGAALLLSATAALFLLGRLSAR